MKYKNFEYLSTYLHNPTNKAFAKTHHKDPDYQTYLMYREYFKLMLNVFGGEGWELVTARYESDADSASEYIFKRSSDDDRFGTGLESDTSLVEKTAREKAEKEFASLGRLGSLGD